MKYLIDGITKSVLSLANQYKYLRADDEYRVYDPEWSNVDGLDIVQSQNFYKIVDPDGDGIKEVYLFNPASEDDTRKFKITTDFENSLKWCDCYVNFRSIPFELNVCAGADITGMSEKLEKMLQRIEDAKALDKKIYLGNRFSEEFIDTMDNYKNCINKVIREKDLDEIKDYANIYSGSNASFPFHTTMIIGTNSSSGKFSCALKVKKYYEDKGEKVALVHTEETYPFLDDQNGTIYGFCRMFSELTTDQDLQYFQALIGKIYDDVRPDRIIFVTQAGFGADGIINAYQDTNNGRKMKGLWDVFILRSFGANEVIIAGNGDRIDIIENLVNYWNIRSNESSAHYVSQIYLSPVKYHWWGDVIYYDPDDHSKFWKVNQKITKDNMLNYVNVLQMKYPNIEICYSNYGGIKDDVDKFRNSEAFKEFSIRSSLNDALIKIHNDFPDAAKEDVSKIFDTVIASSLLKDQS